ncbi:MAG: Asd/ArgC dimerization domain-containing protein, partial [Bryobacteraceae bacterium]
MTEQNISIVGGESLLGRDLRDQLADKRLSGRLQLIGSDEDVAGILSEQEGEAVVLAALDSDRLQRSDVVFLAGSTRSSVRAYDLLAQSGAKPGLVDVTHGLEEYPNARLRSPMVEPHGFQPPEGTIHVIAHPAASILASLLARLHRQHAIRHAVVQIFEPASERGQVGLTELQQQTTSLLTFKGLPKEIFDAQLSFNMLPRYGSDAPQHLEDVEQRIDRHLATLLNMDGQVPMPSVRLAQAPVFHGYSMSLWIEFESYPG